MTIPTRIVVTGDVSDWTIPRFRADRIDSTLRECISASDLFIPNLEGPDQAWLRA